MGSGEDSTPAKPSKSTASTQETPTTPSYPDWSTSLQAYYGAGATPPPTFFTSTVASPAPHPYLWGSQVIISKILSLCSFYYFMTLSLCQMMNTYFIFLDGFQHLIPPYGTPLPYPAVYPHGVYAHPNTAAAQGAAVTTTEAEGKASEGKERVSTKKSKGSSGKESGKAAPGSGNDGASQSGESGGEGSSDASDENDNQQEQVCRTMVVQLLKHLSVQEGNHLQNFQFQCLEGLQ
uniref:G-box binding protein multifunctional mosaic region domain-containing protein n=1 Tax=Nelumbo nucifera TaxID=4432 RepID=A0A822Z7Z9_NELNU|nr:TPA_asm: hypothetical protein HUJ06_014986 [Nelumbo nucifera]